MRKALSLHVSLVHTLDMWLDQAKRLRYGLSFYFKDMAGLQKPYDADKLIRGLKTVFYCWQCHTTGLSTATYKKAIDAGIDMLDTAVSSMVKPMVTVPPRPWLLLRGYPA